MSNEKEKVALADFNWDEEDNFFTEPIADETEDKKEKSETSNPKDTKEKTSTKEKEDPEVDEEEDDSDTEEVEDSFEFGDTDETEDDSNNNSSEISESYSELYKKLKAKGVFKAELPEEFSEDDIDEDTWFEIQSNELDHQINEALEEFANDLDDEGKAFIKFKKDGGDTKIFLKAYNSIMQTPTIERGNEKSYEKFLKHYYSVHEQMDDEDVSDKIDWLKETGKLEKYALKVHEEVEEDQEKYKEQLIKNQEKAAIEREKQRKAFVTDIKKTLNSTDKIKDWTLTPKDKKELHGYVTKPSVKVGNQYLTQLQHDLQEAFKDKEKIILLAKLLNNDFDISDIKEQAKTEFTKNTKNTINNSKKKTKNSGGGSRKKSLSDYFD